MSFVVHRVSKSAARYTDAGGREKCGYCRFFVAPRACGKVIGPVSPAGWCKYFSRQVAQQYSGAGITGGGGPPGATLALDFMSSGNMPAGITFTRASTATYTDASGVIQTAAVNQPRWDYAGGALRGLLIEEARTNINVQSGDFTTGWALSAVTPTNVTTPGPSPTTVSRIAETATTAIHFVAQNPTLLASTSYTLSVYAKAAEVRYLQLSLDDNGSNGGFATFDLQTGTISAALTARGTGVIGAAAIQPAGNGFYRCFITSTIGAGTVGRMVFSLSNVAAPPVFPSYAGNAANGLLLFGGQIEQGAFPTSLIPTTGATATRANDFVTMPTAGWYNQSVGTLFSSHYAESRGGVGRNTGVWTLDDGGFNRVNAIDLIAFDNATTFMQPNLASSVASVNKGAVSYTNMNVGLAGVVKTACAWGASQMKVSSNGLATQTSALTGLPTVTTLIIGLGFGGLQQLQGHMRQLTYWPRVLSDVEMQAITT